MEGASDAEINGKVQNIMSIIQLPYHEFLQYYREYNEHMQNPGIAVGVETEFEVKVQKLTKDIQLAREKLEKSSFFEEFMRQMQNPEMVAEIEKVIDTDPHHSQLQLVVYGVGRLTPLTETEKVEQCQMQFAFAILLREKFPWVNDIEVYDPIHSVLETRVINEFNCRTLHDEGCRRTVDRPTLFFMPHLAANLYLNVLAANWSLGNLNKTIILGNSFNHCLPRDWIALVPNSDHVIHEIPLPRTTVKEACPAAPNESSLGMRIYICSDIDPDPVFRKAFDSLSWHFLAWDVSLDDPNLQLYSTL